MPKNSCYQCIVKALNEEVRILAEIEFLIGVVPLCNTKLQIFKWERSPVYCLLEGMTTLLYQLVRQFMKEDEINECKTNKDLRTCTQIKLENIDYGTTTKKTI